MCLLFISLNHRYQSSLDYPSFFFGTNLLYLSSFLHDKNEKLWMTIRRYSSNPPFFSLFFFFWCRMLFIYRRLGFISYDAIYLVNILLTCYYTLFLYALPHATYVYTSYVLFVISIGVNIHRLYIYIYIYIYIYCL